MAMQRDGGQSRACTIVSSGEMSVLGRVAVLSSGILPLAKLQVVEFRVRQLRCLKSRVLLALRQIGKSSSSDGNSVVHGLRQLKHLQLRCKHRRGCWQSSRPQRLFEIGRKNRRFVYTLWFSKFCMCSYVKLHTWLTFGAVWGALGRFNRGFLHCIRFSRPLGALNQWKLDFRNLGEGSIFTLPAHRCSFFDQLLSPPPIDRLAKATKVICALAHLTCCQNLPPPTPPK